MNLPAAPPAVLSIAGSDPSGGAGIQADMKTFAAHNVYGMSVLTALTSQNTTGVSDIHVVPTDFVRKQIDDVIADIPPKCIKTGMLASADTIYTVAEVLSQTKIPCVVDPVMVSTSGSTLLPESATKAYLTHLLPHTTLLTPNLPEAKLLARLTGNEYSGADKSLLSRRDLVRSLAKATKRAGVSERWVLLKGGHAPMERNGKVVVIDILANDLRDDIVEFVSEFSESKNTHGTGSAIAANIALGFEVTTAVEKAIDYVQGAILHSYSMGKGNGPLNHLFRQRNLPFTPYIPVFYVSNVSGKFYDYLLKHPRIKPVWHEYTHHRFLQQLSRGTLPLPAFRHYLVQDYHFLTHFSRSTALGAFKSTSLPTISAAAKILMHIQTEVNLHRTLCGEYGVPAEELDHGTEDLACVAYTRWVTDVGTREDWFALQVAMMPCLLGYGAIARRLYDDPATVRDGNRYLRWIENYVAEDFEDAVKVGMELLESGAVRLSPERVEEIVEIFREGTRLEELFWEMGLLHHEKMTRSGIMGIS